MNPQNMFAQRAGVAPQMPVGTGLPSLPTLQRPGMPNGSRAMPLGPMSANGARPMPTQGGMPPMQVQPGQMQRPPAQAPLQNGILQRLGLM